MAIAQQFQQILGRAPTQDELDYFGKFITSGELQAAEIGQILQSTPEYQRAQLGKDVSTFGDTLRATDEQTLQRGAELAGAQAQSRFAGLGRPNSSAMAAQVFGQTGQLANSLAQSRQSALAQFYGQGLQANAAMGARQGMGATQRGYNERDTMRQRSWDIEDYYRQKNDAADYERAHSGWNAITPEFAIGTLAGIGGKIAGGWAGGRAGGRAASGKGLFGR